MEGGSFGYLWSLSGLVWPPDATLYISEDVS
jgi:hypothetical protein